LPVFNHFLDQVGKLT